MSFERMKISLCILKEYLEDLMIIFYYINDSLFIQFLFIIYLYSPNHNHHVETQLS